MKGQSFEVFKMLLGAVFSISLLLIGMMYISNMVFPVDSYYLIKKGLENAYSAPGQEFKETIFFQKGQIFTQDIFKGGSLEYISKVSKISCNGGRCTVLSDCSILTKFWCSKSRSRCIITFEKIEV